MTRRYVFADEAGDFHFAPKGSKYFVLCTVLMRDCELGHELLRLRRQIIWEGLPVGEFFHCSEDKQPVRDRVFALIAAARDLTVQANILEKSKAQPQVRPTKERFYKYAWFLHLGGVAKKLGSRGDELLVTAASVGTRKQQAVFTSAVNDVAQQHLLHVAWQTHFCPAMADPCLQIADYCTWAIQRKWEGGDDRSHRIISHLINHEYESWRRGATHFY